MELRTHCHATEDEKKVAEAMDHLCPGLRPVKVRTEGYHKNPIIVMTAKTDSQSSIRDFWRMLENNGQLSPILDSMTRIVDDEGVLHLRMGKQEAYLGKHVLASGEDVVVVRMKVTRYSPHAGSVLDIARQSISELIG